MSGCGQRGSHFVASEHAGGSSVGGDRFAPGERRTKAPTPGRDDKREEAIVLSRSIYKRRQGRRLLTLFATAMLMTGTLAVGGTALASTPAGLFELEGNAATAHGAGAPDDWDRVCHQVLGSDCNTTSNTTGASAVAW